MSDMHWECPNRCLGVIEWYGKVAVCLSCGATNVDDLQRLAQAEAELAQVQEDVRLGDERVDEWKKQCRIARQQRDQALTALADVKARLSDLVEGVEGAINTWKTKAGERDVATSTRQTLLRCAAELRALVAGEEGRDE